MKPHNEYYKDRKEVFTHTTKELLLMQSKGKFLSKQEKERVQKYADNKRKNK